MSRINLPDKRKVGHLTLLRQGREITPREYNALAASERLAMIREARGRQKYALMVEATDGPKLVPQVSTQELYLLMRELGLEDMSELTALTSPDQLTTLMDFDIWQRDDIDLKKTVVWLELLLEAGPEHVCEVLPAMESELVVLVFSRLVTVVRGPEAFEDDDVLENASRVEGLYDLNYGEQPDQAKIVKAILDILFADQRAFFLWLMEAIRSETPTMLLERAYQFHQGRMQDHGFADPLEARLIYAYLNPHAPQSERVAKVAVTAPEEKATPPTYLLTASYPQDLLAEILAAGVTDETAWEFSLLLNKVMAADEVDPGDPAAVQATLQRVYRMLNLGLEHLSEGDAERAADIFGRMYLQDLFRVGFSLTLELKHWAEKLQQSPIARWLDEPYAHLLDALNQDRPRFYPGLGPTGETRLQEFETRQQIRQVTGWLEDIEAQEHLFGGAFPFALGKVEQIPLEGCVPAAVEDLTLSDIFLTALANKLLDGEFVPQPLPVSRLAELHGLVTTDGHVDGQLREGTVDWLEELQPDAGAFGHYCLDLWEQEFCPLTSEDLDPRYVGGLIVAVKSSE